MSFYSDTKIEKNSRLTQGRQVKKTWSLREGLLLL